MGAKDLTLLPDRREPSRATELVVFATLQSRAAYRIDINGHQCLQAAGYQEMIYSKKLSSNTNGCTTRLRGDGEYLMQTGFKRLPEDTDLLAQKTCSKPSAAGGTLYHLPRGDAELATKRPVVIHIHVHTLPDRSHRIPCTPIPVPRCGGLAHPLPAGPSWYHPFGGTGVSYTSLGCGPSGDPWRAAPSPGLSLLGVLPGGGQR